MLREIIQTSDGSKTIYIPEMQEQYHSINGAITESMYVFIEKGYLFQKKENSVIFEVGFGTGLNALLTADLAIKEQIQTDYITIEKYPLDSNLLQQLNYGNLISKKAETLFAKIHECEWNKSIQLSPFFNFTKMKADLTDADLSSFRKFDVVFFDAFGPDKQPEMWDQQIFDKIFRQCSDKAVFVTYSAKGEVRRRLSSIGFRMERLPGPPGKKEMLRGIKDISNN